MKTKQNNSERVREEGVNVLLAQALGNRGLSARAERRSRQGFPTSASIWEAATS